MAIGEAIVEDLMRYCPQIAKEAAAGRLVYQQNFDLSYGHATWNTDLAIGQPPPGPPPAGKPPAGATATAGMRRGSPATVRIAIEAKAVMTEHRKAIKNRKRDLEAHHQHVHDYDPGAIAGGIIVLNASPRFQSPLVTHVTEHKNVEGLLSHCIGEINSISMAGGGRSVGLDAKCAVIVSMDNIDHPTTAYYEKPPAPQVGSPIHWDSFIQRICNLYTARF